MGLFGKSKQEKERERLFGQVKEAAAASDMGRLTSALLHIRQHPELPKDPELPFLLDSAVTGMAKQSIAGGLHMAIWSMNYFTATEAQPSLISKIFALTERVDRTDMTQLAVVAMAMTSVAAAPLLGPGDFERARHEWLSAVSEMAAEKAGLQYAFAAASNAAIGLNGHMPLRKDAIEKWDEIVMNMAKTDRSGALTEAFRMAKGYDGFGNGADDIRARADSVIKRIVKMAP